MKPVYCFTAAILLVFAGAALFRPHVMKAGPDSAATVNSPAAPAAIAGQKMPLAENYGKLPLSFEANQGQTDSRVKFVSRGRGYALFLTGDEAVLTLGRASQKANRKSQKANVKAGAAPTNLGRSANGSVAQHPLSGAAALPDLLSLAGPQRDSDNEVGKPRDRRAGPALPFSSRHLAKSGEISTVLRMRLVGANARAAVTGADQLPGKTNYFIGNDPKKWRTNVPNYAKVKYSNVYPGVDLVYYGNQGGQLEYDFVVAPGADPSVITLGVAAGLSRHPSGKNGGVKPPLQITADGDLVVKTDGGEVRFHKPIVYQRDLPSTASSLRSSLVTRHSSLVEGHFALQANNHVGFKVPSYDHTRPLVIDPVLSYATYLGGSDYDTAYGIAVDTSGNAYVVGYTYSTDFPTVNPSQATLKGYYNAFVAKLNATGSALVYSTYLGGNYGEFGKAIAVDSSGNAYVTGLTGSTDFPTVNPLQANIEGETNAFVAKLNAAGSALVYATYLGGSPRDWANGIAVDSSGNAYVTGYTESNEFPTVNPLQATLKGYDTAFVAKLNAAGSALVYSTYLGGSQGDSGNAIAVDSSGNAYVTGLTRSTDFPTVNPFQGTNPNGGTSDTGFVAKLNAAGSALVYSTYLGGSSGGEAQGIAVDSSGNAYVTGLTGPDFPTVNPFQGTNHGFSDAFVAKLNAAGSALVYSTYLGGSGDDYAYGIVVDASGNAYLTGYTNSVDFPTVNPIQVSPSPPSVAFVSELNAAGSALVYSTYLGGGFENVAEGIAVDGSGNAYVAGYTLAHDFPTVDPLQATNHTRTDRNGQTTFVAKIGVANSPGVAFGPGALTFTPQNVGTPSTQTLILTAAGSQPLTLTDIEFVGTNAPDFTQTNNCGALPAILTEASQCILTVTFNPQAPGPRTATLTVTDNAAHSPQTVPLTGGGLSLVNGVFLSSAGYPFGLVVVGASSGGKSVSLVNDQPVPLTGISMTITGSNDYSQTSICATSIGAGGSCTITVTFTPTVLGSDNATLVVTDSAGNSPQTAVLTGAGVAAAVLTPVSTTYPKQKVGTPSAAKAFTLTNNLPTGALNHILISTTGDFAVASTTCGTSLAAGSNCTINVVFTPSAMGVRSGTLIVSDNSLISPQTSQLTGYGY